MRSIQFWHRGTVLTTALLFSVLVFSAPEAQAQGSWGSFGSGGSFGSSGGSHGSWGSSGGLLNGRRPVRNLLARIGDRLSNLGRGSHGSSGGSSGRSYGSFGSSGGSTGYSYASTGWYGGSSGGSVSLATPHYATAIETSYTTPMAGSMYMEQSYPVGDYGLQPGYPIYNGGQTGLGPAGIQDGGPIDSMLEQPYYPQPASPAPEAESETDLGAEGDSTFLPPSLESDQAILRLQVPEAAKVYINDQLTTTPGTTRSYESNGLDDEREYHYQVKVELEQGGQKLVRSKLVSLRPGTASTFAIRFDEPAVTTLQLNVPEDAEVRLCGKATTLSGKERKFVTTRLEDGKSIEDYQIEVSYLRDGERVTDTKEINLVAGDMRILDFGNADSDQTRIAAR